MTNAEKYKTAKERNKAFSSFCKTGDNGCKKCQLKAESMDHCSFLWLELEAEEEKPMPCPFCGGETDIRKDVTMSGMTKCSVICWYCEYGGKEYETKSEAIAAHNRVCKAVAAYKKSEVKNG